MTAPQRPASNSDARKRAEGVGVASALAPADREAVRTVLLAAMSEWSEEHYAAGWLIALEARLHREGGIWESLGRLVGWPIGCDAEAGWESWDDAGERFRSADYHVENYGRVIEEWAS